MTQAAQVIAIVGPTASGKSSLAERVALRLRASIVSVDAMQVYRGMDIGTAKSYPTDPACSLEMVDVADVNDEYSVRLFQRDARACIDKILASGKQAVLCGGTGLYLDAVIDEMEFPAGGVQSDARQRYEAYAREHGADALHELLRARDGQAAELIHPNNVRRVVRALEMLDEGTSYSEHHQGLKAHHAHYASALFAITMDRTRLYRRIDQRVEAMFEQGLVDEVRALLDRGLAASSTARQAIGYKEVIAYLEGACSLDEARELVKQNTRRYAKRQLSWLRRDGRVTWIDYETTSEDEACDLICSACGTGA